MSVTRPTKEQVRAYMHARECARRPPPLPEEIRQQLGWQRCDEAAAPAAGSTLLLPGAMVQLTAQLATLMAVEWYFLAAGLHRSH
jgi:hypothetical protein